MKNTLLFLALLISLGAFARITGKVISVHDGDTFTMLDSTGNKIKVRLHGIDCPEIKQPYADKATAYTRDLILGQNVSLEIRDTDRYGRVVAVVYCGERCLNENLLSAGLAWQYKRFDTTATFRNLELGARHDHRGMWCNY